MVASPPMGLSSGWGLVVTIRTTQALRLPRLPHRALRRRSAHLLEFIELAAGRALQRELEPQGGPLGQSDWGLWGVLAGESV